MGRPCIGLLGPVSAHPAFHRFPRPRDGGGRPVGTLVIEPGAADQHLTPTPGRGGDGGSCCLCSPHIPPSYPSSSPSPSLHTAQSSSDVRLRPEDQLVNEPVQGEGGQCSGPYSRLSPVGTTAALKPGLELTGRCRSCHCLNGSACPVSASWRSARRPEHAFHSRQARLGQRLGRGFVEVRPACYAVLDFRCCSGQFALRNKPSGHVCFGPVHKRTVRLQKC